jgi:uncharacterized protein YkuJ
MQEANEYIDVESSTNGIRKNEAVTAQDTNEDQSKAVNELENNEKIHKLVEETGKKKSHKLRFEASGNKSNPTVISNNQLLSKRHFRNQAKQVNSGTFKSEAKGWKLEYRPTCNKTEVLEKLKQEIYDKNTQKELELQMKRRPGLRSGGDAKNVAMFTSMEQDFAFLNCFRKRDVVSWPRHGLVHGQKKDERQNSLLAEIKDPRVKSSTRHRSSTLPLNRKSVTVNNVTSMTASSAYERNRTLLKYSSFLENREMFEAKHIEHKCEKTFEEVDEQNHCNESDQQVSSKTSVTSNEILEKYFSSNNFPPLSGKSGYENLGCENDLESHSFLKCPQLECSWSKDHDALANAQSEDKELLSKKNIALWKNESNEIHRKIKAFIDQPVPELSPSSLLIRRSTVANISFEGFSKGGSTDHAQLSERKKSHEIVNIHTCPNVNVFTDRSWMYQDRRAQKCRYIRMPQTPVPTISEIFDKKDTK